MAGHPTTAAVPAATAAAGPVAATGPTGAPADGWPSLLRRNGLRATAARAAVLGSLAELGHGTPEQVLDRAARSVAALNLSTVYRTLEVLATHHVVAHTHLAHQATTYMLADHADHAHLVCRRCGRVTELDQDVTAAFAAAAQDRHGFEVDAGHLSVFGRCAVCAAVAPADRDIDTADTAHTTGDGGTADGPA